ncbi:hypothetical protein [Rosistilla oblonga]|uniref:hypothetical protein n=1 Tax=Rosistilla oblonga TaxID=2527990 RepID=UPI003A96F782
MTSYPNQSRSTVAKFFNAASLLALSLGLMLTLGCDDSDPRTGTVSGFVSLDDQPLGSGNILLLSESGASGGAELAADGTYTLSCTPGKYLVAVMPIAVEVGPDGKPTDPQAAANVVEIPMHYQDVGTSEIAIEVVAGDNDFHISLDSKSKR